LHIYLKGKLMPHREVPPRGVRLQHANTAGTGGAVSVLSREFGEERAMGLTPNPTTRWGASVDKGRSQKKK